MRKSLALCLLLPLVVVPGASASSLYESKTIVTGMDARSRPEGLMRTLRQVLVKVSGNPAWLEDARVGDAHPQDSVQSLLYLDRFTNQPKHDEQGSRDRPFDLVVRFDRQLVESLLQGWGDQPWPAPRPVVAVTVEITPRIGPPFRLRADTDVDERHRGALVAAAERFGLEIALPAVLAPPPMPKGSVPLDGRVIWSESDFGWNSVWSLPFDGIIHRWSATGEGFDAAYRHGIGEAAAILSGHRKN